MALGHNTTIASTKNLVLAYDMGNTFKSWKGAPTNNQVILHGQDGTNPFGGDGSPTNLGIDPVVTFRKRKVAKFRTGTSGNFYLNGSTRIATNLNSTVWTSRLYIKRVDGAAISSVGTYMYITGNTNVNISVSVTQVEDGWYEVVRTRSGLVSGYPTLLGCYSLGSSVEYYIAEWMIEPLSFPTPFVEGGRTNNQAILDLTGNNTITTQNLSYNSDNTFEFDGTDDRIECGTFSVPYLTVNTWVYKTSSSTNQGICRKEFGWAVSQYNGTLQVAPGTSWTFYNTGYTIPLNTWVNISYTYSGTGTAGSQTVYVNGSSVFSTTAGSGPLTANTNIVRVGFDDNGWYWGGRIAKTVIYNKALSAHEVKQNFNALRGRYGI